MKTLCTSKETHGIDGLTRIRILNKLEPNHIEKIRLDINIV